jgi:selenoprotein W-related protein
LEAAIKKFNPQIDVKLIESSGGVFEVTKDGQLIFSKKKLGRHPDHKEILDQLK